jgi:Cu/Ag efflux pump CusA
VRLGEVARVRFDLGPGLVRRENVQRLAMLTANVEGADLVGAVERARVALAGLALPPGYQVTFGGQFEEAARSQQSLGLLSILALAGMYGLLLLAFRDRRHVAIVLVNLPLALIGGVAAVALHGGVLSVASIVGFVTLFGIATRNGVLLVSHYEHLLRDEGASLREAVVRGSSERLAPVLMTALTAGLALVPRPRGRPPEIQSRWPGHPRQPLTSTSSASWWCRFCSIAGAARPARRPRRRGYSGFAEGGPEPLEVRPGHR